jgi:hypothetical protein
MNITFTDKSARSNTINAIQSCSIVSMFFALVAFSSVGFGLWTILTTDELGKAVSFGTIGLLLLTCSYLISNLSKAVLAKVAKDDEVAKDSDYMDRMNAIEDRAREDNDEISDRLDKMEENFDRKTDEMRRDLFDQADRNNETVWRKFTEIEEKLSDRRK